MTVSESQAGRRTAEVRRIGERVRDLRLARGMTQAELADAVGVHRVTITRFESGTHDLGVSNLRRLANVLHVEVGALFDELGDG